jgi:hypothetical protein
VIFRWVWELDVCWPDDSAVGHGQQHLISPDRYFTEKGAGIAMHKVIRLLNDDSDTLYTNNETVRRT